MCQGTPATGLYGTLGYTYDAVGNRLTRTISGTPPVSETYAYPTGSNRLSSVDDGSIIRSFTYDANGNVVTDTKTGTALTFVYGHDNRMLETKVSGVTDATFAYNALGERVSKEDVAGAGGQLHFHYGPLGETLAISDNVGVVQAEYILLDGLPIAQVTPGAVGGDIAWIHTDHLGAPQKMTDAAKAIVWDRVPYPFGATFSATGARSTELRFPGQFEDTETEFHYNYFRDYDPLTGRFVQSDPIGLAGGLNTYAYVKGNPLRYVDPDGRLVQVVPIAIGLGILATGAIVYDQFVRPQIQEAIEKIDLPVFCPPLAPPAEATNPLLSEEAEETPETAPDEFEPVRGSPAKKNKKTREIWEKDRLHKDHYEVYKNKKRWEKGDRDRSVWSDGRPKEKF